MNEKSNNKKEVKQKRRRKSVEEWKRGILFRFSGRSVVLFVRLLAGWLVTSTVCVLLFYSGSSQRVSKKINNLRWNEKVTWFSIELCGRWSGRLRVGNLCMLVEREIAKMDEKRREKRRNPANCMKWRVLLHSYIRQGETIRLCVVCILCQTGMVDPVDRISFRFLSSFFFPFMAFGCSVGYSVAASPSLAKESDSMYDYLLSNFFLFISFFILCSYIWTLGSLTYFWKDLGMGCSPHTQFVRLFPSTVLPLIEYQRGVCSSFYFKLGTWRLSSYSCYYPASGSMTYWWSHVSKLSFWLIIEILELQEKDIIGKMRKWAEETPSRYD